MGKRGACPLSAKIKKYAVIQPKKLPRRNVKQSWTSGAIIVAWKWKNIRLKRVEVTKCICENIRLSLNCDIEY